MFADQERKGVGEVLGRAGVNNVPVADDQVVGVRQKYEADFCLTNAFPFPKDFGLEKFHALRIELKGLKRWLELDSINVGHSFEAGIKLNLIFRINIMNLSTRLMKQK